MKFTGILSALALTSAVSATTGKFHLDLSDISFTQLTHYLQSPTTLATMTSLAP